MTEFVPYPKVPRLSRGMIISEKIDGTNASVWIEPTGTADGWARRPPLERWFIVAGRFFVSAASRSRFLAPGKQTDNFGFAAWVEENADDLAEGLGVGVHYGEWWGGKIQRSYDRTHKAFSLFDTSKWCDGHQPTVAPDTVSAPPGSCRVVPVLYRGMFATDIVMDTLAHLGKFGSVAEPGFKYPEGIMIYHEGARQMFKKTFKDDAEGKGP